jgi:hypothetical protein
MRNELNNDRSTTSFKTGKKKIAIIDRYWFENINHCFSFVCLSVLVLFPQRQISAGTNRCSACAGFTLLPVSQGSLSANQAVGNQRRDEFENNECENCTMAPREHKAPLLIAQVISLQCPALDSPGSFGSTRYLCSFPDYKKYISSSQTTAYGYFKVTSSRPEVLTLRFLGPLFSPFNMSTLSSSEVESLQHMLQPTGLALANILVAVFVLVLSVSSVCVRSYVRHTGRVFGWDDGIMVFAAVRTHSSISASYC